MAKTMKQIADDLGVSKQRVYRYIKKNHINETYQETGVMYFDDAVVERIKQGLFEQAVSNDVHQENRNDTMLEAVIDMLRKELESKNAQLAVKDEQIRELNERLAESNTALVTAQQTAKDAQALHAGTIQQQLEAPKKKGWLARWRESKE